jgi:hypothetical protein
MIEQVDFLAHEFREPIQLSLVEAKGKIVIESHRDAGDIERFFSSVKAGEIDRHIKLWRGIECENFYDKYRRWLFAFCSVHTTYENNMAGYLALKDWEQWINRPNILKEKIIESRMGLYNDRTPRIHDFTMKFFTDPHWFDRNDGETWVQYRDRLVAEIKGLGKAKVSFALEMMNMESCEVFCADTHLFQAYGLSQETDLRQYEKIERHWIQMSKIWNIPSPIARAILWNRKKDQPDCSYWASVFSA